MLNQVLPHGEIEKVFENIWFVQGQVTLPMLLPIKISKSMTIIRNPEDNSLTLINAMPLDDAGLAALTGLGEIKNTLRVGGFHGRDDLFYREKFGAKVFALKGHVYSKSLDSSNSGEGYMQADVWLDETSPLPVPDASLKILRSSTPPEAILCIHQQGGILVTADALHHVPAPNQYFNGLAKVALMFMGFFRPYNVGPGWARAAKPSLAEVRSILELEFAHVLPGHGSQVIGDAKEKYRPILESRIKSCRA